MSRDLTRRRHGRHREFDRIRQPASDSLAFMTDQTTRLDTAEGAVGIHDSMHLVQGEGSVSSFEQVQAATDPTDIGLTPSTPPLVPQTTSIEFNGVNEAMRNQTQQLIGIANDWSIMMWQRRRGGAPGTTATNTFLQIFGSAAPNPSNRIFIRGLGATGLDPLEVEITANSGAPIKIFRWNQPKFVFDAWYQMVVTWNGSSLVMYQDGAVTALDVNINNGSGTMTDGTRLIQIGQNGGVQPFSGFIHSIAVFDTALDAAAVTELYNAGVASTFDLNAASFAGNLAHWWRLGLDPGDLGKDYTTAGLTPLIDVDQDSLNIGVGDIDSESPA